MGIIAGLLFWANGAIATKAEESTYELLPFTLRMIGLFLIFLIMTTLRIWFDLAESDVVLNDQRAVRRAIAAGFRHTFHSLGRLLGSYVLATLTAAIILVAGLWVWIRFIPSSSVTRAFPPDATHHAPAADSAILAARHRRLVLAAANASPEWSKYIRLSQPLFPWQPRPEPAAEILQIRVEVQIRRKRLSCGAKLGGVSLTRSEKLLMPSSILLTHSSTPAVKHLRYLCSATVLCDIGCGGNAFRFSRFRSLVSSLFPVSALFVVLTPLTRLLRGMTYRSRAAVITAIGPFQ